VKVRFAYDTELDPPAPVIPVRVSGPTGETAMMLPMLVDTGADCTLLPVPIVRLLGLPQVDTVRIVGVGEVALRATRHVAVIEIGPLRLVAKIAAFVDEAVLGRDVLNQAVVTLDGPGLAMAVTGRSRAGTRRRRPRRPS
jgi:predicted aspartyl protease